MYSKMCSLDLTHPRGAVGSPAPRDRLQILSQYLGQGYWLEINLMYMIWWWGKPEHQEKTHTDTERTCKLLIERPGVESRTFLLWGDSANHYCHRAAWSDLISFHWGNAWHHSGLSLMTPLERLFVCCSLSDEEKTTRCEMASRPVSPHPYHLW